MTYDLGQTLDMPVLHLHMNWNQPMLSFLKKTFEIVRQLNMT